MNDPSRTAVNKTTAGPPPLLIAGPTGVGKSAVTLRVAEKIGGEIVSVDSMQVYRGMDIGTAKPTAAERARVPHHLVDIADISAPFDAAQFIRHAQAAITEIQARGRVPVLCGGTGLYFKALRDGLGEAPPADARVRAELEAAPLADLLEELRARDPATHEKIDRQNPRRVIRALEVIRLTGKPFSTQRAAWTSAPANPAPGGGLYRGSADLQARIDRRVDEMFRDGLVAETAALLPRGLAQNPTAQQAIGYRQVIEHLRGERSLPETIALVKIRTRQFAKRQMTWFRRQAHLRWLFLDPGEPVETTAERVLSGN